MEKTLYCVSMWALLMVSQLADAASLSVDRSAFRTAVAGGAIRQQDFDTLTNGAVLGTLDGVTYHSSSGSPLVTSSFLTSTRPNGLGRSGVGFFLASDSATISFGNAITAFAIDVNTFADNDGAYVATVNNGPLIQSRFETFAARSTGQFIGFVSTAPFSSITINAKSGFAYTLDTLVYGDADAVVSVAEPTSLGLLSVVLVAIARLRRRPDVRR